MIEVSFDVVFADDYGDDHDDDVIASLCGASAEVLLLLWQVATGNITIKEAFSRSPLGLGLKQCIRVE